MKRTVFVILSLLFLQTCFSQSNVFDIARTGTVEEMKKAVDANPKLVNSVNEDGYSLLILAAYRGNNEVAKFLIANGANIDGSSNYGSPLMAAAVKGNLELVQVLLQHKANTSIADPSGNTALIYATIFKKYDIVKALVEAKADLSLKDLRGNSALDYAKITNDDKLMQLLKK